MRTPIDANVRITHRIPSLKVNLFKMCLVVEVYILGMKDFDVILRMDWLETHYALLDCCHKRIMFQKPGEEEFTFQYPKTKSGKFFISALKAGWMIERGCEAFLASVVMDNVVDKSVKNVKEFEDVFSEDLSSLPPDREIEFSIDLLLGSSLVSIAPYRMAPAELAKLKK